MFLHTFLNNISRLQNVGAGPGHNYFSPRIFVVSGLMYQFIRYIMRHIMSVSTMGVNDEIPWLHQVVERPGERESDSPGSKNIEFNDIQW